MQWQTAPDLIIDQQKTYTAVIHTNKGDITFSLFSAETPITVNNFVFLARSSFYDSVKFHRIIKGFMAQSGDPTGTGAGGPGYRFNDEPVYREYLRGTIAMANAGPNTNGSQFFIMHQDYPLPKNYTIFGIATDGIDVIDVIANTPVTANPSSGEPSQPTEEILITSIDIREE
ncbi:peptidylprolyl isomerase [SAR202 cluster bacterium AD-802-E10_MRT_200m]|nr:peptidylprolyl isomerase [SAR202 cluster bacterium AD-802-E10_MRT_200m]